MNREEMRRPLLLGHRGARAVRSIPENSLLSFDRALADGCDGFELDVRLTGDGAAVVWHDKAFSGVEIARASMKELAGLTGLEQVLEKYRQKAFLDIELKVAGLEKRVVALIEQYSPERGVVISSFLPEVLRSLREADARIPLGLICETDTELRQWNQIEVEYVIPHYKLTDPHLISRLKQAGKKIFVWTVNSAKQMRRFTELEVEGIISDDPSLLARTLK